MGIGYLGSMAPFFRFCTKTMLASQESARGRYDWQLESDYPSSEL